MKLPRITILGLMTVVVVVALDCGSIKWLLDTKALRMPLQDLLLIGILPWANALGFAAFRLARREAGRAEWNPFWLGFVAFGTVGLLTVTAASLLFTHDLHRIPMSLLPWLRPGPGLGSVATLMFFLPQLAFALLGGVLSRVYRVRLVVERREPRENGPFVLPGSRSVKLGGSS